MTISYAITVCNELEELSRLIDFLQLNKRQEDEIVVQYDESNSSDEVIEYLKIQKAMHGYTVVAFPLNKDFASFKNNLTSYCNGDYIFQIDADEIPHAALIDYLPTILESNPVDVVFVPRVNTVEGLTDEHISKWRWKVNEEGWVNWPDFQTRLYRNNSEIKWHNKVHEVIRGHKQFAYLPMEEEWALYHPKDITRQERQNNYYNTL